MARRGFRQRGMSLLEVALALGVSALVMVSLMQLAADGAAEVRARAVADRLAQVSLAAKNYVRTHYTQILTDAGPFGGGGTLVIPVTGPGVGALPSLQGGGFLPSTYIDLNAYNQQHALLVREVAANRLEVLVTTYGGQTIQDKDLGRIAARVGAEAGFMMSTPTSAAMAGQVQGSYGGWRSPAATWANPTAAPAVGHVMATLSFDSGTVLTDFLYRYDIGVPQANRMETAIDMNGNDLNNVSSLDVRRIVNDVGDVEVDDNLHVTANVAADADITAGRDLRSNRHASVGLDLTVGRDAQVNQNLRVRGWGVVETDLTVNRNLTVGQDAVVGRDVAAARDVTGRDMIAQNIMSARDVVSRDKGRTLAQSVQDATVVATQSTIDKPTCPAGQTPQVFVTPTIYSDNGQGRPILSVAAYAEDLGSVWRTRLFVVTPNPSWTGSQTVEVDSNHGRVVAFTKCT